MQPLIAGERYSFPRDHYQYSRSILTSTMIFEPTRVKTNGLAHCLRSTRADGGQNWAPSPGGRYPDVDTLHRVLVAHIGRQRDNSGRTTTQNLTEERCAKRVRISGRVTGLQFRTAEISKP